MGVPSKQIGWSQEAILLHAVSKQLERLQGIIASSSGGGGGGSQNLQQTLENGSNGLLTSPNNDYSSIIQLYSDDTTSYSAFIARGLTKTGGFYSLDGKSVLFQQLESFSAGISFENPIASGGDTNLGAEFKIPAKPEGTYVLATLDDITLQKVLDLGKFATFNSDQQTLSIFNGDGTFEIQSYDSSGLNFSLTEISENQIAFTNKAEDRFASGFSILNGNITFTEGGSDSFSTLVKFVEPTASTVLQFPAKSSGTYTVATLEDIYAVGALIPTYADNAAAITGGLAVNKIYKTATGEIRVRV